jgi:hypothetical protein
VWRLVSIAIGVNIFDMTMVAHIANIPKASLMMEIESALGTE